MGICSSEEGTTTMPLLVDDFGDDIGSLDKLLGTVGEPLNASEAGHAANGSLSATNATPAANATLASGLVSVTNATLATGPVPATNATRAKSAAEEMAGHGEQNLNHVAATVVTHAAAAMVGKGAKGGLKKDAKRIRKQIKCIGKKLDTGEIVSDLMDASMFIWAVTKRCGLDGKLVLCEVDFVSALKSVNSMADIIFKVLSKCDALESRAGLDTTSSIMG